ncbi:MAG TPA: hypothetical protein ENJ95_22435 [Bacteroidetes bacterium]|nr:hypothetical protein [Bacteroidota bacterium]
MQINKSASLFIYRIREKGLEIFLHKNGENWQVPEQSISAEQAIAIDPADEYIALDPVQQADGKVNEGVAVEGDWHDIPSLKSLVMDDVKFVKKQIEIIIPEAMEKGTFVAVKEAFKRVLPHQYEMLKELKDIIIDRNSVNGI